MVNTSEKIASATTAKPSRGERRSVVTSNGYVLPLDDNGKPILPRIGEEIHQQASLIGDCFGGIGSTGILCSYYGLRSVSLELERRFVDMAQKNFELHRNAWEKLGLPEPVMLNSDSRHFGEIMTGDWCQCEEEHGDV